jgi:hypothetical protein
LLVFFVDLFYDKETRWLTVTIRWLACEYTAIAREKSKLEFSLLPSMYWFQHNEVREKEGSKEDIGMQYKKTSNYLKISICRPLWTHGLK